MLRLPVSMEITDTCTLIKRIGKIQVRYISVKDFSDLVLTPCDNL